MLNYSKSDPPSGVFEQSQVGMWLWDKNYFFYNETMVKQSSI